MDGRSLLVAVALVTAGLSASSAMAARSRGGGSLTPIGGAETATHSEADTSFGVPVACIDAATGTPFSYRAARLLASGSADSAWSPDSSALCLGSAEGLRQMLVRHPAGGGYAAWVDARRIEPDIWIQRFGSNGEIAPGWLLDGVPVCTAPLSQHNLSVAPDGAGGVLLAWEDFRSAAAQVYVQRIDEGGSVHEGWISDGVAIAPGLAGQRRPSIAPDGSGGAWVVWEDARSGARELWAQRLGASGAPASGWSEGGARLVSAENAPRTPLVATDTTGAGLIAWREVDGSGGWSLRVAAIPSGPPAGDPAALVLSSGAGELCEPAIAGIGGGAWVVAWAEWREGVGEVRAQRIEAGGGSSATWSAGGVALGGAGGGAGGTLARGTPVLAPDGAGGAYAAWEAFAAAGDMEVVAQRVAAAGAIAAGWPAPGLTVTAGSGDRYAPRLGGADTSGVVVTWIDAAEASSGGFFGARHTGQAPHVELIEATAYPSRAVLAWRAFDRSRAGFSLYRSMKGGAWEPIAALATGDSGAVRHEDRSLPEGAEVSYRLAARRGDAELFYEPVSLAIPAAPRELLLRWAHPEHGAGAVTLAIALPAGAAPRLELMDVSGRRIAARTFEGLEPGEHRLRFEAGRRLPPGVYFLRLHQGAARRVAKLVYLR